MIKKMIIAILFLIIMVILYSTTFSVDVKNDNSWVEIVHSMVLK